MVDIIDVMLARALTPQGQIDTYAARAGKAVSDANAAVTAAESAVSNIESITEQTNTNNEAAAQALQDANDAISAAQTAISNIENLDLTTTVETEINKLSIDTEIEMESDYITKHLILNYDDSDLDKINNFLKMYIYTGNHIDGTMTQKAITEAIQEAIQDALNSIEIPDVPASSINLGIENAGKLVKVGNDGNITYSDVGEIDLYNLLISTGLYRPKNMIGIVIDYENKTIARSAMDSIASSSFDNYAMFGARKLCIVNDNGEIIDNDPNTMVYDGSQGQVMVYQPKFYYQRVIETTETLSTNRAAIKKEWLYISPTEQPGMKLHPLFINENGEELDYVLLSAFEGSVYDTSAQAYDTNNNVSYNVLEDKLSSVAGVKPANGATQAFTIDNAKAMAANRGTGWQITNMEYESAQQMLMMFDFCSMNMQSAIENGICSVTSNGTSCNAAITGSTINYLTDDYVSGYADSSVIEINGTRTTYSTNGYRAVYYRGVENPFGNMWRFIDNVIVVGDGTKLGGEVVYNGHNTGMYLPNSSNYIGAMYSPTTDYDWMYIPAKTDGNSSLPVGDSLWTTANLNGTNVMTAGGNWYQTTQDGIFFYACDKAYNTSAKSYGARLMYVPQSKNTTIYNQNKALMTAGYEPDGVISEQSPVAL